MCQDLPNQPGSSQRIGSFLMRLHVLFHYSAIDSTWLFSNLGHRWLGGAKVSRVHWTNLLPSDMMHMSFVQEGRILLAFYETPQTGCQSWIMSFQLVVNGLISDTASFKPRYKSHPLHEALSEHLDPQQSLHPPDNHRNSLDRHLALAIYRFVYTNCKSHKNKDHVFYFFE